MVGESIASFPTENDHGCESDSDSLSPTLFKLSGVDTSLGDAVLEDELGKILLFRATLLEKDYNGEEGTILFCCCRDGFENKSNRGDFDAHVLNTIGEYLQQQQIGIFFIRFEGKGTTPVVSIVDEEDEEDECVEYITEEEAYQLWLEQNQYKGNDSDNSSDTDTDLVSSPDGALVKPKHHVLISNCKQEEEEKKFDTEESHLSAKNAAKPLPAATAKQLERDPGLFHCDNVVRVHYTQVLEFLLEKKAASQKSNSSSHESWKESFGSLPIVFYGLNDEGGENDSPLITELEDFEEGLRDAIRQHGTETIVRTGNRETLVANGFHNSKPATLSQVVDPRLLGHGEDTEGNSSSSSSSSVGNHPERTIVFNPIHEMPPLFRSENVLGRWINYTERSDTNRIFPNSLWGALLANVNGNNNTNDRSCPKYTLCIASEGFGIGMHKHGPALFFLTEGRKKWYLSHPGIIDERIAKQQKHGNNSNSSSSSTTHPGFYKELSTHKCIQEPGELLLVPNLWYHEIYNLASPTIGIQALVDELPIPGTLSVSFSNNTTRYMDR